MVRYRPGRPEDALRLQRIVQEGFETYRAFAPPGWEPPDETRPEMLEQARRELGRPQTFSVVAEVGGEIAGHVTWVRAVTPSPDGTTPDVHLRHLFVRERHWGTGIARALHDRALVAMRDRGLRTARLFTPAGQARARRFYEREGWAPHFGPWEHPDLGLELVEYRRSCRAGGATASAESG